MAFLGQTFDATQVEPQQDFTPIPSGEYPAMIIDSDVKTTKAGTGQYLEITEQIIDGPYKGRLIWGRINVQNQNAQCQEIGARELSSLCHAVGRLQVNESTALHNIPHIIRVEYVKAGPKRDRDGNEIKNWKKMEGAQAAALASSSGSTPPFGGQQQPAQQQAPAAPGWANKAA